MRRRWIVLQHVDWEGPGLIGEEARARGLGLEVHRLDLVSGIPSLDEIQGLVVMGGPMGAYETDKHPVLAEECALLAELVRHDRPVLGVCLGAQLLAKALGARVYPGQKPELGFGLVQLNADAEQDPVFRSSAPLLPVFHWHGDTFDLPLEATLLASSPNYRHQAFRVGTRAYGLQFHIEIDKNIWRAWKSHLPAAVIAEAAQHLPAIEAAGRTVIAGFFDLAS